jgi:oleandomycin transport system permease protein
VPVETMPGWLQGWANVNPVSQTVDAARALALDQPFVSHLFWASLWIVGILAVFVPLAVSRYRKVS